MAKHNELGKLGEKIAIKFLKQKGFSIIDTNYNKKWGEIDIIALAPNKNPITNKERTVHFIEVKSTGRNIFDQSKNLSRENKINRKNDVSYETLDTYRPEEMIHPQKIKRLRRVIQTYILEKNIITWQFDVIVVYIDENKRVARCRYLKDIIL